MLANIAVGGSVAPRAGAWIEITSPAILFTIGRVAPRAGAWIEIYPQQTADSVDQVAPRAGAWIEIQQFVLHL